MKRSGTEVAAKFEADKTAGPGEPIDVALVRALAEMVGSFDLAEIEVESERTRIRVTRHTAHKAATVAPAVAEAIVVSPGIASKAGAAPAVTPAENPGVVKSPMVGTVYRRPSPDAKPLVEIGDTIKTGDRVLLVEAMKTFNEILAHRAGTVTEILVEDGQPVEYGEPLMIIG